MKEFRIKSSDSDLQLILSDIRGNYYKVQVTSNHIKATREIWAYTDAYGFVDIMDTLASYDKPWPNAHHWESLEGEFKFSATCSNLGKVTFEIELSHYGCAEEWTMKIFLNTELGQLPRLADSARIFFDE